MHSKIREEIRQHARSDPDREVCGIIFLEGNNLKIEACENIAETYGQDPKYYFIIDPIKSLHFIKNKHIAGIYHSHVVNDQCARNFTEEDIKCANTCLSPFYMYDLISDKFHYYCSKNTKIELIGRPFIWGYYDCYGLVKDFFLKELDIHMNDYERDESFFENPDNRILENFKENGFTQIYDTVYKPYDALLFNGKKNMPQHLAVVMPDNTILHHVRNRLSARDTIGSMVTKFNCILRHKNFV